MNAQTNIAIVGANGYTGGELLRLLAFHPNVQVTVATSRSQAGQAITQVFPNLCGADNLPGYMTDLGAKQVADQCDLAFTCLPHGDSQTWVADLRHAGIKVIDLSADYRFNDTAMYEKNYVPHNYPELAAEAAYGLTEWNRSRIAEADLIANPGCYPTSVLLALLPLARAGLLGGRILVDSQTGVSGAGRNPKPNLLHGEISESLQAYSLPLHRHEPEMIYQIQELGGSRIDLVFTAHLAPVNRGILSTIHVELDGAGAGEVRAALLDAYSDEPFVTVLPDGQLPRTAAVRGGNHAQLQITARRSNLVTLLCAIDNLGKGAAAQAVHNMNVRMGWPETLGLYQLGLMP